MYSLRLYHGIESILYVISLSSVSLSLSLPLSA